MQGGLYFAIGPAAYMVMTVPAGIAVDAVSSKRLLLAAGFLAQAVAFSLYCPLWHVSEGAVAASSVLVGLSAPFLIIPALPVMLDDLERTQGEEAEGEEGRFVTARSREHDTNLVSSMYTTATSLGSVAGPLISASLIPAIDFDGTVFSFACCLAAFGLLQFYVLPGTAPGQAAAAAEDEASGETTKLAAAVYVCR
jgi:MFS family permease